jgi:hypothetical protein
VLWLSAAKSGKFGLPEKWKLHSKAQISLFPVPQIHEQFDRPWPMPGVMVVGEGENLQDLFVLFTSVLNTSNS